MSNNNNVSSSFLNNTKRIIHKKNLSKQNEGKFIEKIDLSRIKIKKIPQIKNLKIQKPTFKENSEHEINPLCTLISK